MSIKDGRYVITQNGCPHCEDWKKENSSLIKNGKIKETNLSNLKEGSPWWSILENLAVEGTPSVVEIDGDKVCEIDFSTPEATFTKKCATIGSVQDIINQRIST